MLINDIECAIRLWVDDEEGNSVCDEVFCSFAEMNAFLKTASRNEKYDGLTAQFSPVEVINGQPDESVRFIYDICPILELEPDEIEEFCGYFEEDFQASNEMREEAGKDTEFVPMDDAVDYESKKKHFGEFSYICPYCYREIDDCRCALYPYYLVQIDTLMVPIIRVLNKKGYITTACCSGHIEENHCLKIYIAFKEEHNFGSNIPSGAVYAQFGQMVRFDGLENMTPEERKVFQAKCIQKLTKWADNLPALR